MGWNPAQYEKFAQPRLRPALDLLARVRLDGPRAVADLGCGTGAVTRLVAERWPDAAVFGVDDSPAMLAEAAKPPGRIQWRRQNVAQWMPEIPIDLVVSNAALHWLADHASLFPRLLRALTAGGVLAVQMPRNFAAPSHTLIADTVRGGPWRAALEPLLGPSPVGEPAFYYRLLKPLASSVDVWECDYLQVLSGNDPVKEWVKGTWLAQFLDRLPPDQRAAFEDAYAQRVATAYPREADGTTLFPFRRLFIVATKA